jgi:hypothetical protein
LNIPDDADCWLELEGFDRLDLKPYPVRVTPTMLTRRLIWEARNVDGRAAMIVDSPPPPIEPNVLA